MANIDKIIYALRCASTEGGTTECKKADCPYYYTESIDTSTTVGQLFAKEAGKDYFDLCDYEKMALDAAEVLETFSEAIGRMSRREMYEQLSE